MGIYKKGLFWDSTTDHVLKKEKLLQDEGWIQIASGFWAEQWRLDKDEKPELICKTFPNAYKIARSNKVEEKRQPPPKLWLNPNYLPGLEEAQKFNIPILSDSELVELSVTSIATQRQHKLVFDIECYGNYFLIAFMSLELEKVTFLELSHSTPLDIPKIKWILDNFCIIGFNSRNYDLIITALAVHGCTTAMMKAATNAIIEHNEYGSSVLRKYKAKPLKLNHIDIIEVAPLFASLKIYGGRIHTRRMQDLPFNPETVLSDPQIDIVRWYCVNDLRVTKELYQTLEDDIILRESMGVQYQCDLRSKSDAQIAEVVIGNEMQRLTGRRPHKPVIDPGTTYTYNVPAFIKYNSELMQSVLTTIRQTQFVVSEHGNITLPEALENLKVLINQTTYTFGLGGLHSTEKAASHFATQDTILKDIDVVSYYPQLILNLGIYPKQLGPLFLEVYQSLVTTRIKAKRSGDIGTATSLKIVVNGAFGKLGSKYSIMYSPDSLIQVTITGQLSMLMLVERLELAGIPVVSVNTDGLVIKCLKVKEHQMNSIVNQWEKDASFETEETQYAALFSRDINNYLAIKAPSTWKHGGSSSDKVKLKGIFAKVSLSKNPQNRICIDAVIELLLNGTPIKQTIYNCKDIRQFINVRTVKGGAVKLDKNGGVESYLGKAIRWYYADDEEGKIVYGLSGNLVARTVGAKPLMDLENTLPNNIDYDWYEKEADSILNSIKG